MSLPKLFVCDAATGERLPGYVDHDLRVHSLGPKGVLGTGEAVRAFFHRGSWRLFDEQRLPWRANGALDVRQVRVVKTETRTMEPPEHFRELATTVGEQADDLAAAIRDEHAAEAEVLFAVIANIRPALKALSSRLVTSASDSRPPPEWHSRRGCFISVTRERKLALLDDGSFAELVWQVEPPAVEPQFEHIDHVQAVERFPLSSILDGILRRLREQLEGKAPERARQARARATRLWAIAILVNQRESK